MSELATESDAPSRFAGILSYFDFAVSSRTEGLDQDGISSSRKARGMTYRSLHIYVGKDVSRRQSRVFVYGQRAGDLHRMPVMSAMAQMYADPAVRSPYPLFQQPTCCSHSSRFRRRLSWVPCSYIARLVVAQSLVVQVAQSLVVQVAEMLLRFLELDYYCMELLRFADVGFDLSVYSSRDEKVQVEKIQQWHLEEVPNRSTPCPFPPPTTPVDQRVNSGRSSSCLDRTDVSECR